MILINSPLMQSSVLKKSFSDSVVGLIYYDVMSGSSLVTPEMSLSASDGTHRGVPDFSRGSYFSRSVSVTYHGNRSESFSV